MSILKRLIRGHPNEQNEYFYDRDGKRLYNDDIVARVRDEAQKRRDERSAYELQWQLNANYLCGNQYCTINPQTKCIQNVNPVHEWMSREVFNQIAPIIETRIANLKKINYRMKVKPRTTELDDYAKAEVSTTLLQYLQSTTDFDVKKNSAIGWNELCGNCFILSWWDNSKGNLYAEIKETVLDENGIETVETKSMYEGDLAYGLLSPYEVLPESIFKQGIEGQRSIIVEQALSVDDVFDIYGVKVDGEAVTTFQLTPTAHAWGDGYEHTSMTIGTRTMDDAVKVITRFEKPSRQHPHGVMTIVLGDKLFYHGKMPYDRIPIVQITCREVPGQFFGKSIIEDLIPRQDAYNGVTNRMHDYLKRITHGGWFAEEGSININDFTENGAEPGAVIPYTKNTRPPIPFTNSTIPPELFSEQQRLKTEMEYVAGTSQLMMNGTLPTGITSGTAIENLMNVDNTRLSLTGDNIRNSVKELMILWLDIYKKFAVNKRVIECTGLNKIGYARTWCNEDINSFDVEYTTTNELMQSEETQKQKFFDAYNMGLFADENGRVPEEIKVQLLKNICAGSYNDLLSINNLEAQHAQRENSFFDEGVIPEVKEFDDHNVHLAEHMRYWGQMRFKLLEDKKPELAKAFEDHMRIHKQAIAEEKQKEMMGGMIPQMGG